MNKKLSERDKFLNRYNKIREKIDKENPWRVVNFKIYITPEPYARPRKSNKLASTGKNNIFYNPRSKYKTKLKKQFLKIFNEYNIFNELVEGEVNLELIFGLTPPKKFRESKLAWELVKNRIIKPIVRPDIDNWCKPIMDVLNKLAYTDDGQITKLVVDKIYSTEINEDTDEILEYIDVTIRYRQDKIKLR